MKHFFSAFWQMPVTGQIARIVMLGLALLSAAPALGQSSSYIFLHSDDPVGDKNFYLFTALAMDRDARIAVAKDPVLRDFRDRSVAAFRRVQSICTTPKCIVDETTISDADIRRIGNVLAQLAQGPLQPLIRDHLRPSGRFQLYAGRGDAEFLQAAWEVSAHGVNRLYRIYALGQAPRYPKIDAASYDASDGHFFDKIRTALDVEIDGFGQDTLFFDPWSRLGLDLLSINQRDEAGRFEPLAAGENASAMARAGRVSWHDYPYSAIVVPGEGLEARESGLSAMGAFRLQLAIRRFRQGQAPFIVVSGGNVHPNKTVFNEAMEMRHRLMSRYGIPADSIFVDPYARHTTTNLRNAVRILFYAGAPLDRDILVTTTPSQSAYIESTEFRGRNKAELGYQPMTISRRLSTFDLIMRPELVSLQIDPADPLDP